MGLATKLKALIVPTRPTAPPALDLSLPVLPAFDSLESKLQAEGRHCPSCGYDVKNPHSERCPRCFVAVPKSKHTNCSSCAFTQGCPMQGS